MLFREFYPHTWMGIIIAFFEVTALNPVNPTTLKAPSGAFLLQEMLLRSTEYIC